MIRLLLLLVSALAVSTAGARERVCFNNYADYVQHIQNENAKRVVAARRGATSGLGENTIRQAYRNGAEMAAAELRNLTNLKIKKIGSGSFYRIGKGKVHMKHVSIILATAQALKNQGKGKKEITRALRVRKYTVDEGDVQIKLRSDYSIRILPVIQDGKPVPGRAHFRYVDKKGLSWASGVAGYGDVTSPQLLPAGVSSPNFRTKIEPLLDKFTFYAFSDYNCGLKGRGVIPTEREVEVSNGQIEYTEKLRFEDSAGNEM